MPTTSITPRRIGLWLDHADARKLAMEGTNRLVGRRVLVSGVKFHSVNPPRCHVRCEVLRRDGDMPAELAAVLKRAGRDDIYDPVPAGVLPQRLRERLNRRSWIEGGQVSRLG